VRVWAALALVGCAGTTAVGPRPLPESGGTLIYPLGPEARCSRGYDAGAQHFALDLATAEGAPVRASAAGVVVRAAPQRDYGRMVVLDHRDGLYTLYAHLSAVAVSLGERVDEGEVIGSVGHTGDASGDHLHWEVVRAPAPLAIRPDGPIGIPGDVFRVDPALEVASPCSPR